MAFVELIKRTSKLESQFYTTPNSARMYFYLLGGRENYLADRTATEAIYQQAKWLKSSAIINRAYVTESVRLLLSRGVRQFLDLGCGYPCAINVHDLARTAKVNYSVVYVDKDPGVGAHAKFRLDQDPGTTVICADFMDMNQLLTCEAITAAFNLNEPIAVLLNDSLPWCTDNATLYFAMNTLREWMPFGSSLSITHLTDVWHPREMENAKNAYAEYGLDIRPRSYEQIQDLFGDFAQQGPGLTATGKWHAKGRYAAYSEVHSASLAGMAVK